MVIAFLDASAWMYVIEGHSRCPAGRFNCDATVQPPWFQLNAASACLLQLLNLIGVTVASLVVVLPWFGLGIDLLEFQFLRVGLESLHQSKCFLIEA